MNIIIITNTIIMKYICICSGHNMNDYYYKYNYNEIYIYICSGHNMNINIITNTIIMKCIYIYVLVII